MLMRIKLNYDTGKDTMKIKKGMGRFGWITMLAILMGLLPLPNFGFCVQAAESKLGLEQILDHMETRYTGKSFTAQFIQESSVKAMEITDFASGKMFVRYPGKMRWEYEKPEKQIIITDGFKLWIYRPDDNQVMTGSAPIFFRDGKGASFLSDIKLVRKKFEISLEDSREDFFYELKLIPREKSLDVTDIRLSVTKNSFTVVRVITHNSYGDENRIELLNNKFDVKIDDSLFSFSIPPGADVLQMDE